MKISDKIANEMLIKQLKNNLYSFKIFFATSNVNRTVNKSVVTAIRFTTGVNK